MKRKNFPHRKKQRREEAEVRNSYFQMRSTTDKLKGQSTKVRAKLSTKATDLIKESAARAEALK